MKLQAFEWCHSLFSPVVLLGQGNGQQGEEIPKTSCDSIDQAPDANNDTQSTVVRVAARLDCENEVCGVGMLKVMPM